MTLSGLADLARGLGGGKFEVNQGKRGKMKCALDLEAECGGKVGFDKTVRFLFTQKIKTFSLIACLFFPLGNRTSFDPAHIAKIS